MAGEMVSRFRGLSKRYKHILLFQLALVVAGVGAIAASSSAGQWRPASLVLIFFALAVYARFLRVEVQQNFGFTADLVVTLIAAVQLGPAPAAVIGVSVEAIAEIWRQVRTRLWITKQRQADAMITGDKLADREHRNQGKSGRPALYRWVDPVASIWGPLLAGLAFQYFSGAWSLDYLDPRYYVLFLAVFTLNIAFNLGVYDIFDTLIDRYELGSSLRIEAFLIPIELIASAAAMAVLYAYNRFGEVALAVVAPIMAGILFYYWAAQKKKIAIERNAFDALTTQVQALHARDNRTGTHCAAVATYAYEIACGSNMSTKQRFLTYRAGLVHDVGKTGWPEGLLDGSKGRDDLTDLDRWHIKNHPLAGADKMAGAGFDELVEVVRCHHENLDGSGYPRGYMKHRIPEISKIIRVADTYDVITARDTYQDRRSKSEAIAELRSKPGLFEQRYVEALITALEKDPELNYRHQDRRSYDAAIDFYQNGLLRKKRPPKGLPKMEYPKSGARPTGRESAI